MNQEGRSRRTGLIALAAIVAVAAVVVLILVLSGGGDEDEQSPVAGTPPPTGTTDSRGTTDTGNGSRDGTGGGGRRSRKRGGGQAPVHEREKRGQVRQRDPGAGVERIVVRDGFPVGGRVRLNYRSGQRVRLVVRSDRADVVRIRELGQAHAVTATRSARFDFRPTDGGLYGVELEKHHTLIAILAIR
jgi:hypothetical protein